MQALRKLEHRRIDILDYARFFAALSVMVFHYSYIGIKYGAMGPITFLGTVTEVGKYGYLGVELFFIISGFVIFTSSKERTASQFLVARALRLYPAFIFCVLLTALTVSLFGAPKNHATLRQIVANFSMLAPAFGEKHLDASYWTLGVELKFYIMVFLIILFGFSKHLEKFFMAWGTVILTASIVNLDVFPSLSGYCSYFCAGALFAMRMEKKNWPINVLLAACFYYSLRFSCINSPQINELQPISSEIIAATICIFYILFWIISSGTLSELKLPFAKELGIVTYPLYLVHQSIGYVIISHFATNNNKTIVITITIITMVIVAFLVHHLAEIKPYRFWKTCFNTVLGQPVAWCERLIGKARIRLGTFPVKN